MPQTEIGTQPHAASTLLPSTIAALVDERDALRAQNEQLWTFAERQRAVIADLQAKLAGLGVAAATPALPLALAPVQHVALSGAALAQLRAAAAEQHGAAAHPHDPNMPDSRMQAAALPPRLSQQDAHLLAAEQSVPPHSSQLPAAVPQRMSSQKPRERSLSESSRSGIAPAPDANGAAEPLPNQTARAVAANRLAQNRNRSSTLPSKRPGDPSRSPSKDSLRSNSSVNIKDSRTPSPNPPAAFHSQSVPDVADEQAASASNASAQTATVEKSSSALASKPEMPMRNASAINKPLPMPLSTAQSASTSLSMLNSLNNESDHSLTDGIHPADSEELSAQAAVRRVEYKIKTLAVSDIRVVSARIKVNSKAREVVSYLIRVATDRASGTSWNIEKHYVDFVNLDTKLRASFDRTLAAKIGRTPDKTLFNPTGAFKDELRCATLEMYLHHLISLAPESQDLIEFVSTSVIDSLIPDRSLITRYLKNGDLYKRGKNFGGWKVRHFWIHPSGAMLFYSAEPRAHGEAQTPQQQIQQQLDAINLRYCYVSRNIQPTTGPQDIQLFGLMLNEYKKSLFIGDQFPANVGSDGLPDARIESRHILYAESETERDAWVHCLSAQIQIMRPQDGINGKELLVFENFSKWLVQPNLDNAFNTSHGHSHHASAQQQAGSVDVHPVATSANTNMNGQHFHHKDDSASNVSIPSRSFIPPDVVPIQRHDDHSGSTDQLSRPHTHGQDSAQNNTKGSHATGHPNPVAMIGLDGSLTVHATPSRGSSRSGSQHNLADSGHSNRTNPRQTSNLSLSDQQEMSVHGDQARNRTEMSHLNIAHGSYSDLPQNSGLNISTTHGTPSNVGNLSPTNTGQSPDLRFASSGKTGQEGKSNPYRTTPLGLGLVSRSAKMSGQPYLTSPTKTTPGMTPFSTGLPQTSATTPNFPLAGTPRSNQDSNHSLNSDSNQQTPNSTPTNQPPRSNYNYLDDAERVMSQPLPPSLIDDSPDLKELLNQRHLQVAQSARDRKKSTKMFKDWVRKKMVDSPQMSSRQHKPVFGVSIQEAVAASRIHDNYELPAIVFRCIEYLDARNAYVEEGLYRLSGSSTVVQSLKSRFDNEGDVNLLEEADVYSDVHAVTGLLKQFLRELAEPLLTRDLRAEFFRIMDRPDRNERLAELVRLVSILPIANYTLLRTMIGHLIRVVHQSKINKMSVKNVSILFSPTLGIPGNVFTLMMAEYRTVFQWSVNDADRGKDNEQIASSEGTASVDQTPISNVQSENRAKDRSSSAHMSEVPAREGSAFSGGARASRTRNNHSSMYEQNSPQAQSTQQNGRFSETSRPETDHASSGVVSSQIVEEPSSSMHDSGLPLRQEQGAAETQASAAAASLSDDNHMSVTSTLDNDIINRIMEQPDGMLALEAQLQSLTASNTNSALARDQSADS